MKYKTLMIIKAVVCLIFGFLMLAFPNWLLTLMGAPLEAPGLYTSRLYGAALVSVLILTTFARDAGESKARRAIILALFIYDAIGVVVSMLNVLNGTLNWIGWGIVAIYAFLTIGFGYLWFAKKPEA